MGQLIVGISLLAGSAPVSAQSARPLILSNLRIVIPYGNSVWEQNLSYPQVLGPTQISYLPSPACPGFGAQLEVRSYPDGNWLLSPYANGFFYPDQRPLTAFRVRFSQFTYSSQTCDIRISSQPLASSPLPPVGNVVTGTL